MARSAYHLRYRYPRRVPTPNVRLYATEIGAALALFVVLATIATAVLWPHLSPASGAEGRGSPLDRIPAEPRAAGEYHFIDTTSSGDPIAWNPCTPIPYWIGGQNLPGGGTDLIRWVLAEITAISGQQFDFQGYTDTVPSDDGDDPVKGAWIGWTSETSTKAWLGHDLDGAHPAVGLGGNNYDGRNDGATRGWAMLRYSYNPRANAQAGAVLRHELGHLLGLAHTMSQAEVMNPGGPTQNWGPGDRRGLWLLGTSRGCEQ